MEATMPTKKLTLSAPADVIDTASSDDDQVIGPVTLRATGVTTLPEDQSDRELLEEALATRYLDGE